MCKQQETNNNKIKKKLYKKSKNSLSNLSKKFKQERDNMDLLSLYNNHY